MSHYQERLDQDLAKIRQEVGDVGAKVGQAVENAVKALLTRDRPLAYETALGDLPINRQVRRLDRTCHAFVARHMPSAGHLRFISSVLRLNVELERVGDYAVNIARQAAQLREDAPKTVARDIDQLATQARSLLKQAVKAFVQADVELAGETKSATSQVKTTFAKVWRDLLEEGKKDSQPLEDTFALLEVFERLSRVSGQTKNICEEAIFAATGETKTPKRYRVLFVDQGDDGLTQMAVAYARKAFPESGIYASAGLEPAAEIRPACGRFLDDHGYDLSDLAPGALDTASDDLAIHHVIVSFVGDLAEQMTIPFHTALLQWEMPDLSEGAAGEQVLTEAHRQIAHRVHSLMATLRGEETA